MAAPLSTWRSIGWNAITLSCPMEWEAIVSGDTHLLFEKDFQPVLELRWHEEKRHNKRSIDATLLKIAGETGLPILDLLPPHWNKLSKTYAVKLLTGNDTQEVTAAILICKSCGTTLLLYFFCPPSTKNQSEIAQFLSSICCHTENNTPNKLWAVQDFRIRIPTSFRLTGHNFGAGLTRISFTDSDSSLNMHLCRLAGASQRLKASSMATLLNLLGDVALEEEEVLHLENTVSHCSTPSLVQQIRIRLKRKQPFHQIILRHHPEQDRLSGLFFFDKKPIPEETTQPILESYEIVSL